MIGQLLKHYKIESKLGAGGMGVVYLARDTHLGRSVALKVLPPTLLKDPSRRKRFVQEAKTASALNHPNIITIYDIDSVELDGQSIDFIAMEYIEGKTLDLLIGKQGMPVKKALRAAAQIAGALTAAHTAGIVHRDVKPANVMVTEEGLVKVLDFGLARMDEKPEIADPYAPTQALPIEDMFSDEGMIVGTLAYMSPEQAESKKADARSDIFSFGSVLYEMITGERAFIGDSKVAILAAILNKEPRALEIGNTRLESELDRVLGRCLKKDPKRRWQTMADLKIEIEELQEDSASLHLTAHRLGKARLASSVNIKRWIWPMVAGIILSAVAGGFLWHRMIPPKPAAYRRITFRRGDVSAARFAPDGQTIVYSAEWDGGASQIYSTTAGSRESRPLGLPGAQLLSISSTGELAILLNNSGGTLARVQLAGGEPRHILEKVSQADWSPDGKSLAVVREADDKFRLEFPIGKMLYETRGRPPLLLRVSPRGDNIAFFDFDLETLDFAVSIVDLKGKKRILSRGWKGTCGLGWSADGGEVWFNASVTGGDPAMRAVSLTGKLREVTQAPVWLNLLDIGRDGRILLTEVSNRMVMRALLPAEKEEKDLSWLDTSQVRDISSDGKSVLFLEVSYGDVRNPAIYVRKTDGSPAVRLGDGVRASLSPDGKWVASTVREQSGSQLLLLPSGAGESRSLTTPGMRYESAEWFPDGNRVLFNGGEKDRRSRVFAQDLSGGKPMPITSEGVTGCCVSPDAKQIVVKLGGKFFLYPVSGGEPRALANAAPNESAIRWHVSGDSIFVGSMGRTNIDLLRMDARTGTKNVVRQLRPPDPVGAAPSSVTVTPDGASYAFSFQRDLSNLFLVTGLK